MSQAPFTSPSPGRITPSLISSASESGANSGRQATPALQPA